MIAWAVAAVALALGMAAVLLELPTALRFYHAAVVAWVAVPAGSTALLLLHRVLGGGWGESLGPALHRARRWMVPTALCFVPILFGLPLLFPWAEPGWAASGPKAVWLDPSFFVARSLAYLAVWSMLALWLGATGRMAVAAVGLVLYPLTASLAGVDWIMTLSPQFNSSIFGLLVIAQHGVAALAFAVLATVLQGHPRFRTTFATLLLAAVLTWIYFTFMQYLVIWSTDLPHEAAWYVVRTTAGWWWVAWAVMLLHGLVPLLALMVPPLRHSRIAVAGTASLLLVMHLVETGWMVLPEAGL